jgi:hypothetical protein
MEHNRDALVPPKQGRGIATAAGATLHHQPTIMAPNQGRGIPVA